MTYTLKDGAGVEQNHVAGSLTFDSAINRRGTCSFRVITAGTSGAIAFTLGDGTQVGTVASLPFAVGEEVYVYDEDGALLWGGTVDTITETDFTEGSITYRALQYRCIDFDQIATRKVVAASYTDQTLAAIVSDIVTTYLADEDVTEGTIETGPVIARAVFSYLSADRVLDELAEQTGFAWWIDASKALQFRDRSAIAAPFSITAGSRPYRRPQITRSRSGYRNAQYIRAGLDLTDPTAETFVGDGTRRTFTTSLPVGAVPTIEVDTGAGYVTKTVGVNGVDTGVAWYYNVGRTEVTQAGTETVLATTHTVRVTYRGQYPIIVRADDTGEQASRAAAEGFGTGYYEAVETTPEIDDYQLALDKALALLRRHGQIPTEITYETDESGLAAGQLQAITLPDHELSGDWLIETVKASTDPVGRLVYSVKAVSGEAVGGWQAWFRRLRAARETYVVRENEMLIVLRQFSEVIALADAVTTSTSTSSGFTVDGADSIIGLVDVG